jgi:hypothetical protein
MFVIKKMKRFYNNFIHLRNQLNNLHNCLNTINITSIIQFYFQNNILRYFTIFIKKRNIYNTKD